MKKKFKKLKKHHYDLFLMLEQVWKGRERVKIKIIVLIISYRTPNREFKKRNIKKIQKIKKHHYCFFPSETRLGKAEKE